MTPAEFFLHQTFVGITVGAYFALIALGYTMVYGIIELINFAHGDLFAFGFLMSLALYPVFGLEAPLSTGQALLFLPIIFIITMLLSGLLNVAIDRIAYRPLRNAPRLAPLITAVAASFILENLFFQWYDPGQINYPAYLPVNVYVLQDWFNLDTAIRIRSIDLLPIVVPIPLMIGLTTFVARTRTGKAMRAAAQDRDAARMVGINVERIIMFTFFIGGALAGAAGMIVGLFLNTGRYIMGFEAGLFAFTAAVLGGIGNIRGAVVGGFFLGIAKVWSDSYLAAAWTRSVIFAMLILVLVFFPSGLLGSTTSVEKV
jgi:branched-chain amino acid transport system permease protein